jgi:ssDNA-binding Zn-finger/Zn-ribbon topoisomerase 1
METMEEQQLAILKEEIGMRAKRKFFDIVIHEPEKPGFRNSGKTCPDCDKAVPLKYRGNQENPESFEMNRCDECYIKTAEGFVLRYNYNPWYENASGAGFYCIILAMVARYYWQLPWIVTPIIFIVLLVPGTMLVNRASRRKTTPQQQAEHHLNDVNAEDERIKRFIDQARAEAAELERIRLRTASGIDEIDVMTGVQFERRLQSLFVKMGYLVQSTPASGDQGLDLILKLDGKHIGVQAKRYSKNRSVGNSAVQEVIAGKQFYGCDEGWVITNCKFTIAAKTLAKKAGIRLIDREQLIKLLAHAAEI